MRSLQQKLTRLPTEQLHTVVEIEDLEAVLAVVLVHLSREAAVGSDHTSGAINLTPEVCGHGWGTRRCITIHSHICALVDHMEQLRSRLIS